MLRVRPQARMIRDGKGGALSLFYIFIILIIIVGGVTAGYLLITAKPVQEVKVVTLGDDVKVDYIGMFENSKVFDTSMLDVARDNATYPKALTFDFRTTGYEPLQFSVGTGQMIQGFDEAVLGMKVGDSKTVTIPPEKGYGSSDLALIEVRKLIEEQPIEETMNKTQFLDRYLTDAVEGTTIVDWFWQWNVSVLHISDDIVTIQKQPRFGMIITPYPGWDSQVIFIDSGAGNGQGLIKVEHLLEESDENAIKSSDANGEFIITEVDPEMGTYTVDYNKEVVGKTLIFYIRIIDITKPEQ